MLSEDLEATTAAYRVSYRDASHFNREYKSPLGVPPMRDAQRLWEARRIASADEQDEKRSPG
jgi:AraC-like DNA-binding protein